MKFILTITEIDTRPTDWTSASAWPGVGMYAIKGDTSLYCINKYGVDYISNRDTLLLEPHTDPGELVSESLLLKAIAAASRAKVLT